jgi:hypothetical protein
MTPSLAAPWNKTNRLFCSMELLEQNKRSFLFQAEGGRA